MPMQLGYKQITETSADITLEIPSSGNGGTFSLYELKLGKFPNMFWDCIVDKFSLDTLPETYRLKIGHFYKVIRYEGKNETENSFHVADTGRIYYWDEWTIF